MNQKLQKLRDKCTDKQAKFVKLYKSGQDRAEAYFNAGYKAKTQRQAQINAARLLNTNDNVMAYFAALKAEDDRNTNISRSMQLNDLQRVKDLAFDVGNLTAATSAIREQNEMLGYHRESAPNLEKEQQRKELVESEQQEIERLAAERDGELAQPRLARSPALRPGAKVG